MFNLENLLWQVLTLAPPILMALTVHEVSHGLVAYWRGDPTAKMLGRLTLNPIRHLDLTGTLVFFITALAGAGIGWAKPVPVNPRNLRDPRRDSILVSAAGPAANLAFALAIAVFIRILMAVGFFSADVLGGYSLLQLYLRRVFILGVYINAVLAFFNLIPLPPLDGSGVLAGLLSPHAAARYQELARYGFIIILALIFLPSLLPGFPDLIRIFVVYPASMVAGLLLP